MTKAPDPSPTEPPPPAVGFSDFELDPRLLSALEALSFETATDVQQSSIPVLLQGRDVIGRARTGSGKTAAFGLPLLERVKEGGPARALVLAPTRELACQVGDALRSFAKHIKGLRICTVYGGAPYPPQLKALRSGATVIVGTPGRIIDHLERGSLDVSALEYFVLDEADEMLRMGFIDDVEKVLEAMPESRQIALFSATMPDAIQRVARKHLSEPIELHVETRQLAVEHIQQHWIRVPERYKLDALVRVLRGVAHGTTLVFARTRAGCAEIADALAKRGLAVEALHGDLSQPARERVVQGLRSRRLQIVIATDVAARGIDVEHITHVINLDLPPDAESYVHRIGRTARAGRDGNAISFVTPRAVGRLSRLRRTLKVPIEAMEVPSDADIARLERLRIKTKLHNAVSEASTDGAKALLKDAVESSSFTLEEVAAAAVQLFAQKERVSLGELPEEGKPKWASPPAKTDRNARDRPRRERSPRNYSNEDSNETHLLFPLGFTRGVRPADLVGLLANEADVPVGNIGRITIRANKSFVGVPESVAEHVMDTLAKVNLRGVMVPISVARPTNENAGRKRPPRPDRGRFAAKRGPKRERKPASPSPPKKTDRSGETERPPAKTASPPDGGPSTQPTSKTPQTKEPETSVGDIPPRRRKESSDSEKEPKRKRAKDDKSPRKRKKGAGGKADKKRKKPTSGKPGRKRNKPPPGKPARKRKKPKDAGGKSK